MPRANREWKSFGQRWNGSSRFEKFFFWSVLVHAGLLLLIALPVYSFYEKEQEQIREQQQQQQAEKEKEKEQVKEQAKEEVKTLLKEDLIKEQLKPFFDEITKEFLDPQTAEAYWEELLVELDPELTKLLEELDRPEGFDPVQAEQMVQDLREQLVQQLAKLVERQQLEPLRQEVLAQVKELARQVAEFYRREVAEKVGQPVGEQLRQMVQAEAVAAQAALEKADRNLASALQAARQAAKDLEKAEGRFPELKKQQAKAEAGPKKDTTALAEVRKGVQEQRAGVLAAGKQLDQARAALKTAGDQLAPYMPRAAEQVRSADAGTAAASQQARDAAQLALLGVLDEAAAAARAGKEGAHKTVEALERARAAVQLQLPANQAEALARKLDDLRRQKLTEYVRQKFEQDFKDRGLPALLQKVNPVLTKRLQGDEAATNQFKQELQKELSRILGQDLPARVRAGERFAEASGERMKDQLPATGPHTGGTTSQRVNDLSAKAEAAARLLADKQVPAVVTAGIREAPLGALAQGTVRGNASQAGLLRQLEIFRNQLAANRREFLGRTDTAGLAAAARRYQDRQAGLSRLNDYDVETETYRKLMAALRERGQLTGEEIARQGASGDTSAASDQEGLRPAQVLAPDLVVEGPPVPAPENKDDKPAFKTIRFATVPFLADDAITIDGDLTDWKGATPLSIDQAQVGSKRKLVQAEPAQTAYLAYSPRGLLVAVDVTDTSGKMETQHPVPQFWLNDCVEVYIDTLNTKYNRRGEVNTHQFFAFPFEHKAAPGIGGYESKASMQGQRLVWPEPIAHPRDRRPTAWKQTEKGWTLEMLIPRELLRRGEVQPGRILGFNVQIDTGHSDRFCYWSCLDGVKTSEHPNVWGDVQLLGSDAKIELLGEDGKETVRSVVPGGPVRVRVTDPDMNLDDQKKDKVSVGLRTASGEAETLILEETANGSGIFIGAVATRLNIGSRQPSTLQVFEGEKVTVEYIDQVRSTSTRNVPVRTPFAVSAIGTRLAE